MSLSMGILKWTGRRTWRHDRAVKTSIDRARNELKPALEEQSWRFYGGRLEFGMAAGDGNLQIVPIHMKAGRNNVTNREMEGMNAMGASITVRDRETGTQIQIHGRIAMSRILLDQTTFTSQSNRLEDDDYGILREHAILAVIVDEQRKPRWYSVAWFMDLVDADLWRDHKTRNTSCKLKLSKMAFGPWDGRRNGFGMELDGVGGRYVFGHPTCGAILKLMEDFDDITRRAAR